MFKAVVKEFEFNPMVELVPSTLEIYAELDYNRVTVTLYNKGTIEHLSQVFQFKVENDLYDFSGLAGRKCYVLLQNNQYKFHSFID